MLLRFREGVGTWEAGWFGASKVGGLHDLYCMVHSVGVSRKPDQRVSNGKVKGSGTWEEGRSGASQMGGHICNMYGAFCWG